MYKGTLQLSYIVYVSKLIIADSRLSISIYELKSVAAKGTTAATAPAPLWYNQLSAQGGSILGSGGIPPLSSKRCPEITSEIIFELEPSL